jgi:twitching motility protein PilI
MDDPQNIEQQPLSEVLNQFVPPEFSSTVDADSSSHARYGIDIGGVSLLIPQFGGSEVIMQPPVFQIPNTSDFFRGVCNIRGNIVPVYDFFKAFNLSRNFRQGIDSQAIPLHERRNEGRQQRILILGTGEQSVGLVINTLPQAIEIFSSTNRISELQPLPDRLAEFVVGGYVVDDVHWHELDFMKMIRVLSSNEKSTAKIS